MCFSRNARAHARVAVAFVEMLSQHADDWEAISAAMGNKSSVEVFSFYKANRVELQLDAILESAKESAVSPAGSTTLETPAEFGTPASEPPLTTAAPSAPATPPTLNGASKHPAMHPSNQPIHAGAWPMAPLGASPVTLLAPNTYRMPAGYQSAPSASYPSYGAGSNGSQPPMRPLS